EAKRPTCFALVLRSKSVHTAKNGRGASADPLNSPEHQKTDADIGTRFYPNSFGSLHENRHKNYKKMNKSEMSAAFPCRQRGIHSPENVFRAHQVSGTFLIKGHILAA